MNRNGWILSAGLLAALGFTGSVYAVDDQDQDESQPLTGEYQVVIASTCVRTPFQPAPAAGFDATTKQLLTDGQMLTALGSGLMRFEADGSVQLSDGVQTELSLDQTAPGKVPVAPPVRFTCAGKYTKEGRKVALTLSCDIKVPDPGVTVTLGPQNFEGHVGNGRNSIDLINIAGEIQNITVFFGANPLQQRQRICTQQVTGNK